MKSWISNKVFGAPLLIICSNNPRRYRLIPSPGVRTWIITEWRQVSFIMVCFHLRCMLVETVSVWPNTSHNYSSLLPGLELKCISSAVRHQVYTCGFVLTCMQTEEIEMHASTKIIVVTGFTTELHAERQRVHFSILQPFLLTTYGNNRRLEDIVSDK